jgi:hypothetical protein
MEEQISNHIQKMQLKEGDVLFIDGNAVDIRHLEDAGIVKVPIVPVHRQPGLSVADHIAAVGNPLLQKVDSKILANP